MKSTDEQRQVERAAALVLRAIKRVGADGRRVYSEEQITHAIPWIAFHLGADVNALNERIRAIIVRFIVSLNLPEGATPEIVRAAICSYYEQHPIAPALLADVCAAFREAVVELSSSRAEDGAHDEGSPAQLFRSALQPNERTENAAF